jgi:RNA polymerase sigma-70 factor (ECF subfamily)
VQRRTIVYCILPEDLAAEYHEPLRAHFATDPGIEVIVEHRWRDRRGPAGRRAPAPVADESRAQDRRRTRSAEGRRAGDLRTVVMHVDAPTELPSLPDDVRERLVFVGRLEPSSEELEDRDTARLVGRLQAGDSSAFEALYMRYFDRVFIYLQLLYRSAEQAEDGVQQVFVQVYEQIGRYERRTQPFRAWLFRIVRSHAISDLRRAGRVSIVDPLEAVRGPDESTGDQDDERVLGWLTDRELVLFIERLPLAARQVLMLRYMLGLSNAEVEAVLDRTRHDVLQLHAQALAFLRSRIGAPGGTAP